MPFQAGVDGAVRSGPSYLGRRSRSPITGCDRSFAPFADHSPQASPQSIGARVETRLSLWRTAFGFTPYAALQAQGFHTPRYNRERSSGGGFGLTYNARSAPTCA